MPDLPKFPFPLASVTVSAAPALTVSAPAPRLTSAPVTDWKFVTVTFESALTTAKVSAKAVLTSRLSFIVTGEVDFSSSVAPPASVTFEPPSAVAGSAVRMPSETYVERGRSLFALESVRRPPPDFMSPPLLTFWTNFNADPDGTSTVKKESSGTWNSKPLPTVLVNPLPVTET